MRNYDVLIIGNGILALSSAFALYQENPKLKIGIIGPFNYEGSATMAAGAMLGCFGEVTHRTMSSMAGTSKLEIAIRSAQMWPNWLAELNEVAKPQEKLTTGEGTFVLLNTRSGKLDDKNYDAILTVLDKYKEPYSDVSLSDVPGLNPRDDCRPLRCIYLPREGYINPSKIMKNLIDFFSSNHQFTLIDQKVAEIVTSSKGVSGVKTNQNELIQADQYLIAAGAFSKEIIENIPQLKFKIPKLIYGVGSSFLLSYPDQKIKNVIRSPNRAGACGAHVMPYTSNSLFVGASNNLRVAPRFAPKARDILYLLQRALEQIDRNLHKAEIIKWNVGNRPVSVDTFPVVGKTSLNGLWVLTGTYRDGLHDSPYFAKKIATQILAKNTDEHDLFSPERLPIQTMKREEAINEAVFQLISGAYEHSMELPNLGLDEYFKEMWHNRIHNIYEQLDTDYGIPSDLLIMLDQEPEYIPLFREYYKTISAVEKNKILHKNHLEVV